MFPGLLWPFVAGPCRCAGGWCACLGATCGYAALHLEDAPSHSTDPCCQAQDDLDASKPIPTRVTADCCGDVEAS